jgi:hypothetical protein
MLRALACCCALLALTPRPAAAEWHFIPTVGLTFAGKTTLVDLESATDKVHRQFGGTVTLVGEGILGVESVFVLTPGFFQSDKELVTSGRTLAFMGNAVLTTPRRWTEYGLRPFVSGGLGLLRTSVTDKGDAFSTNTNIAAFNVGGGAVGFFSRRVGVRFDLRYYANLHPTDESEGTAFGPVHLNYMTLSVGLVFRTPAPKS